MADQCWLDSANGYTGGANDDKPGDNTADDGVVCSGDYVEYEMDLKFKGGVNNAVRLVPSVPEGFPLSYSSGKGSFCRSEGQLSAKGYNGAAARSGPRTAIRTRWGRPSGTWPTTTAASRCGARP